jgi:plasmid stability protein
MKYAKVEIRAGFIDMRTSLGRRLKEAGAKVNQYEDKALTFIHLNADERTLIDDVLKELHVRGIIIRNLDDELKEELKHGGSVQAWAVVYQSMENMDQLDAAVEHMIETVKKRDIRMAKMFPKKEKAK